MGATPHFLVTPDHEGGYNVTDTRDGTAIAWREDLHSVSRIAARLNVLYPGDRAAPSWESLVHEVVMDRIGGSPEPCLCELAPDVLGRMIPEAIGGPLDPGLWRPAPRDTDGLGA